MLGDIANKLSVLPLEYEMLLKGEIFIPKVKIDLEQEKLLT